MNETMTMAVESLWRGAVGVVPLAVIALVVVRVLPCRPASKHFIWATVLTWALVAPMLPNPPRSELVAQIDEVTTEPPVQLIEEIPAVVDAVEKKEECKPAELPREERVSPPRLKARPVPVAPESLAQAGGAGGLPSGEVRMPRRVPVAVPAIGDRLQTLRQGLVASDDAICAEELRANLEMAAEARRAEKEYAKLAERRVDVFAPVNVCPDATEGNSFPPSILNSVNRYRSASAPQTNGIHGRIARGANDVKPTQRRVALSIPNFEVYDEFATATWSPAALNAESQDTDPVALPGMIAERIASFWLIARSWYAEMAVLSAGVMAALPPVPVEVWVLGIAILLSGKLIRMLRCRSLLRRTFAAPPSVMKEVREVAGALGIRRLPQTLMVDANVSPMVWCGRGVRLLLPVTLWEQLDGDGRRAVLCHELAHLKRRDHWMLWVDQVAGCVYWWHPVVWWVRRRVHEEAENSCDAWVTWLLPQGRRAYAEALLRTTQFVQNKANAAPIGGIGVVSGRAERFARRIKMVMTENAKPRLSGAGMMMALALAAAGWLASPAQSCPEDKAHGHVGAASAGCGTAKVSGAGCGGKCAKGCGKGACAKAGKVEHAGHAAHGGPAVAGVVALAGDHGDAKKKQGAELEERLEKLEANLERLSEQLERLGDMRGDGGDDDDAPRMKRRRGPAPSAMLVPAPPDGGWNVPTPPGTPAPDGVAWVSGSMRGEDGPIVVRAYQLPDGKLDAVTKLMVRSDVPILVRPQEGRIEVQASERNHAIFKGFVDLISDKKQVRAYRVSPGKLADLNALMVRSDVPILVEPGREVIKLHGSSLEQSVFAAFIEMIDPGSSVREAHGEATMEEPTAPRAPRMAREPRAPRAPHAPRVGMHGGPCGGNAEKCREMELKLSKAIREAQEKARSGVRRLEESQQRLRERTNEQRKNWKQKREKRADGEAAAIEELESAHAMEESVARISEVIDVSKINELIELLASIDVRAAMSTGEDARSSIEEQVQTLLEQAEALEEQGRMIDGEAQGLDARSSEMEAHAEALEAEREMISEKAAAEMAGAGQAELAHVAATEDMRLRAELLRQEAQAIVAQQSDLHGAAESLYQQAEALQEAADALRSTVEEEDVEDVEDVTIDEG